ncbi:hypothetical protein [Amphritea atlantica]|nr:hypothetical protein [Amphritea atlantica]
MIVYAFLARESVVKLFAAGMMPGLMQPFGYKLFYALGGPVIYNDQRSV